MFRRGAGFLRPSSPRVLTRAPVPPKKRKIPPPRIEPREGALTHNPFAALGGAHAGGSSPPGAPNETADPEPEVAGPRPLEGKITVRRETGGRGGKTVTRVLGLPAERLDELAMRMKKALGCGATVEGDDLLLLGSLVSRGAASLREHGATRVVEGN
jgi:translation initiation factor 1